jgi:hypothetical protein
MEANGDGGKFEVKVEQLMTREVKVCTETDTLNRAAH